MIHVVLSSIRLCSYHIAYNFLNHTDGYESYSIYVFKFFLSRTYFNKTPNQTLAIDFYLPYLS